MNLGIDDIPAPPRGKMVTPTRLSSALSPMFRTLLPLVLVLLAVLPWLASYSVGDWPPFADAVSYISIGFIEIMVLAIAAWLLRTKSVFVYGENVIVVGVFGRDVFPRAGIERISAYTGAGFFAFKMNYSDGRSRHRKTVWFITPSRFTKGSGKDEVIAALQQDQ